MMHQKTRAILEVAIKILELGRPMTVRQCYYQLVSRQIIENSRGAYQSVSNLLVDARKDGSIPWEWIEDRLRSATTANPQIRNWKPAARRRTIRRLNQEYDTMPPLKNPRREAFCIEYVRTGNATQSAITARYSAKTARAIASEILTKPDIKARIAELRQLPEDARIMDVAERRKVLSDLAQCQPLPDEVSPRERIAAIAELNKMGGNYPPEKHMVAERIVFEVVYREPPRLAGTSTEIIDAPDGGV